MQPLTNALSANVVLRLGMVTLMVSIHGAVGEDTSSEMRTVCVHEHAPTPIMSKFTCPVCENTDRNSFVKAKQVGDGFVVIPQEILDADKQASEPYKKNVEITVHPAAEVTSVLMPSGKSYYLSLGKAIGGAEAYTLLARLILTRTDLAFMTKVTLRSATSLYRLTVAGTNTLVLRQMAEASLVRVPPVIPTVDVNARTLELVGMLADESSQPFVEDEHGAGKSKLIAAYAQTQTPVAGVSTPELATTGNVLDLTAALEAALAAKKPARKTAARASRTRKVS